MEFPFAAKLQEALNEKFPSLTTAISRKGNKVSAEGMDETMFRTVVDYVVNELGVTRTHEVVGVDDTETLGAIYVFSAPEHKVMLTLKVSVPRENPVLHGLTAIYPNLFWHERELVDLFGFTVLDLPEGPHYPLPDIWPEGNYPMRKDWDPACFDKETMTYTPKPQPAAPAAKPAVKPAAKAAETAKKEEA